MKHIFFVTVSALLLASSCTEEFDLELKGEPKLVIEMQITNRKPPYHTQLIKSKSNYNLMPEFERGDEFIKADYEKVSDALIIVSDVESGVIDTLALCPDSVLRWDDYLEEYYYEESDSKGSDGHYITTKIVGIPEHTYRLRVEWQGNVYTSECKMPKAVTIDTITSYREADKFKDGAGAGFIPYLWFHDDPTTSNYYVFESLVYCSEFWGINIMNDERVSSDNICGIDAYSGEAPNGYTRNTIISGTHMSKERGYDLVSLYSVTKEVYDYYDSLIKQIRYDGGNHSPSPASAPTNIKGGALGVFNAASVDWRYFY